VAFGLDPTHRELADTFPNHHRAESGNRGVIRNRRMNRSGVGTEEAMAAAGAPKVTEASLSLMATIDSMQKPPREK
jgi:hypothetical protein